MYQTLNFNSRQIISKEELKAWDYSLRLLPSKVLQFLGTNGSRGILDRYTPLGQLEEGFFFTTVGSIPSGGYDTIRIDRGWGLFNVSNLSYNKIPSLLINNDSLQESGMAIFYWPDTDNIDAGVGGYSSGTILNIGFAPVFNPMEEGECSISVNNQVTIVGGDFSKLRDQSFKNPTKVRFYNEDGTPANNNQIYEVVQKVSDTQIIVSGVTILESNVKMVIVGSYDLGVYGDLNDKFSYPTVNGELVITTNEDDIVNAGGFIVCELHIGAGGTFTIVDKRESAVFNFSLPPDAMLKSAPQVVTGQKTFSVASPKFEVPKIEVFEPESLVTPLSIVFDADPVNKVLTIPSGKSGSIFTVKSTLASNILGRLVFEAGYVTGTKFFLYVDPTGEPLIFNYMPLVPGSVRMQNLDYATLWLGIYTFNVQAGSVLELLAMPNTQWLIMNSNPFIGL